MFSMSFDPQSLAEIVRLQGFSALLAPEITVALSQAGTILVQVAQLNTWEVFANPTGVLASGISFYVVSPSEVAITADVPYAARREYGFTGHTDSLGRYFSNDPAKPYMGPALDDNQQQIMQLINQAVEKTLARIGGGV